MSREELSTPNRGGKNGFKFGSLKGKKLNGSLVSNFGAYRRWRTRSKNQTFLYVSSVREPLRCLLYSMRTGWLKKKQSRDL